ncbi:MAG: DUF4143 domain-containing protein [Propionibacteriaceae bacterium]|nr:DUF4143 domain-containing protein [Propionibacteriaceae bacterium]
MLQGARQVGKSTLARQLAAHDALTTTLDDQATLTFAQTDPHGFVAQAGSRTLVIDEAQRAPELVLALKESVDRDRRPGRFILTGSVDLLAAPGVGDSLAGRREALVVRPFSTGEVERRATPEDFATWLLEGSAEDGEYDTDIIQHVLAGGFPEPLKRSERRAHAWFTDYVETLARHDAASLSSGSFPQHLTGLLRILSAQGQTELVKARLARQVGVAEGTLDAHLQLLDAMYLLQELPAWGVGFGGRVIRRPKVGVVDTGMAASLSGLNAEQAARVGGRELFGALLEQFVAGELLKQAAWSQQRYRLYHYRQRATEVDIVLEMADGGLVLIEVKSALSVGADSWRHLQTIRQDLGDRVRAGVVLYGGTRAMRMHGWLHVLPVAALWRHPDTENEERP